MDETGEHASWSVGRGKIGLWLGDLATQDVDGVVNAADTKLSGNAGVDAALHAAGGATLRVACDAIPQDGQGRRCPPGGVRITEAGDLPARWVLHAVGPRYSEDDASKAKHQLRAVHEEVFRAASMLGCQTVALPALSTGAYKFPIAKAAPIAVHAAAEALKADGGTVNEVRFVFLKPPAFEAFRHALEDLANE